jgi:hypothetical protein
MSYRYITSVFTILLAIANMPVFSQTLNCEFTAANRICVYQETHITYVGNASASAYYHWNFDGGQVLSGSGQGPYIVQWTEPGEKHITLSIEWENMTCNYGKVVIVVHLPLVFHMTGGGSYHAGGDGVIIGLSGSEPDIIYRLYRNGIYTNVHMVGTGEAISFGNQLEPGTYTCKAFVDGSDCFREMEGTAVVTIIDNLPEQHLCMVTYDTLSGHNLLIWNKAQSEYIQHFNLYRETFQNNHYEKIGEVPYSEPGLFIDPTANPLVKSDRYKISITNLEGQESETSAFHKTIHLNINPGIGCYNLIWNSYEGFEFLTYRIHRKINDDPYQVIDSVASNVTSYTDFDAGAGLATYFIEVLRPEPCHPGGKSGGYYSSVFSNTAQAVPYGIVDHNDGLIEIYPNPVQDILRIRVYCKKNCYYQYLLIDQSGRLIISGDVYDGYANLDIRSLMSGFYLLAMRSNNSHFEYKLLKI